MYNIICSHYRIERTKDEVKRTKIYRHEIKSPIKPQYVRDGSLKEYAEGNWIICDEIQVGSCINYIFTYPKKK